jgi:hypothetical protein
VQEEQLKKPLFGHPSRGATNTDESLVLSRLEWEGVRMMHSARYARRPLASPDAIRCQHCGADIEKMREAVRLSKDIIAGIERAFRSALELAEDGLNQLEQVNLGQIPATF